MVISFTRTEYNYLHMKFNLRHRIAITLFVVLCAIGVAAYLFWDAYTRANRPKVEIAPEVTMLYPTTASVPPKFILFGEPTKSKTSYTMAYRAPSVDQFMTILFHEDLSKTYEEVVAVPKGFIYDAVVREERTCGERQCYLISYPVVGYPDLMNFYLYYDDNGHALQVDHTNIPKGLLTSEMIFNMIPTLERK